MGSINSDLIVVAVTLDRSGLIWHPEIGDEVALRPEMNRVSILVDPQGMTPTELRSSFMWLPTTEQLVEQLEARQAIIYHAGLNGSFSYETVIRSAYGVIEATANSLRVAFGKSLASLLSKTVTEQVH